MGEVGGGEGDGGEYIYYTIVGGISIMLCSCLRFYIVRGVWHLRWGRVAMPVKIARFSFQEEEEEKERRRKKEKKKENISLFIYSGVIRKNRTK